MEIDLTTPALLFSGNFIDYVGLYQPFYVVCPVGTYFEGTIP